MQRMKTIGRIDKADFPELNLTNIKVKVDTGAYTSSIHTHEIKELELDGEKHIEFKLLDPSHLKYKDSIIRVKHYTIKAIKNSFGNSEDRYIITTTIKLFGEVFPVELSLSERSDMRYPVLLGRKFITGRFVVNTALRYESFRQKKEEQKRNKTQVNRKKSS